MSFGRDKIVPARAKSIGSDVVMVFVTYGVGSPEPDGEMLGTEPVLPAGLRGCCLEKRCVVHAIERPCILWSRS